MTPLEIVLMVVRGISTLASNPALGGGSNLGLRRTSGLLDMLATLIEGGDETKKELDAFAKEIQTMVDSNGAPTRGQWEAMQARDAAARKQLLENAAALAGLPPPPPDPPDSGLPPPSDGGGTPT